ncbi:MAG TPA: hypothetical protein VGH36_09430 [Acetobacteraceae bacterium]
MRTFRLAQATLEAERVRLRLRVRRVALRLALGAIGAICLAAGLACLHVAAWLWLAPQWDGLRSALALAGFDIVVAIIMLLLASRGGPSAAEREAKSIRDNAWRETVRALTLAGMLQPLMQIVIGQLRRRPRR